MDIFLTHPLTCCPPWEWEARGFMNSISLKYNVFKFNPFKSLTMISGFDITAVGVQLDHIICENRWDM